MRYFSNILSDFFWAVGDQVLHLTVKQFLGKNWSWNSVNFWLTMLNYSLTTHLIFRLRMKSVHMRVSWRVTKSKLMIGYFNGKRVSIVIVATKLTKQLFLEEFSDFYEKRQDILIWVSITVMSQILILGNIWWSL